MHDQGTSQDTARGSGAIIGFVVGTAIGAGIALLLAPASGAETRRRLRETSRRLSANMRDSMQHTRGRLNELKGDVEVAVKAGREAFAREHNAHADRP